MGQRTRWAALLARVSPRWAWRRKGLWIGFRLEAKVQVIQAEVDVPLQAGRVAHQGAFAYLPGAHDRHHGDNPYEPFQEGARRAGKEGGFHTCMTIFQKQKG